MAYERARTFCSLQSVDQTIQMVWDAEQRYWDEKKKIMTTNERYWEKEEATTAAMVVVYEKKAHEINR